MKRIIAILIALTLMIAAIGAGILLAVKNNYEKMKYENVALFILDEKKNVVMAFGVTSDKRTFLIDPNYNINSAKIFEIFKDSHYRNLIGREIEGIFGSYTEKVRIDRIVSIDISVLEDIVEKKGYIELNFNYNGIKMNKKINKEEFIKIMKDEYMPVNMPSGNEEIKLYIKALLLKSLVESIDESDVETLFYAYKEGRINIYPENMLTKIIKILPYSLIKKYIRG